MITANTIFSGFSDRVLAVASASTNYVFAPIELKSDSLKPIKDDIKNIDLKSISQQELSGLGEKLFKGGLINFSVLGAFMLANADFDKNGIQQNTDKKFDALAYFEAQLNYSNEGIANGDMSGASGNNLLKQVNQVLKTLDLFANSDNQELGVDIVV